MATYHWKAGLCSHTSPLHAPPRVFPLPSPHKPVPALWPQGKLLQGPPWHKMNPTNSTVQLPAVYPSDTNIRHPKSNQWAFLFNFRTISHPITQTIPLIYQFQYSAIRKAAVAYITILASITPKLRAGEPWLHECFPSGNLNIPFLAVLMPYQFSNTLIFVNA